jgi:potassium efflux system protein
LIILFERPMRVGDIVTVGGVSGTVSRIRSRATTITDWDRKELIVPNKEFITGQLVNWTLSDSVLRLVVKVGVAYASDPVLVTKILREIADADPLILDDPSPVAMLTEFGDSALIFELRVFVAAPERLGPVRHELHVKIEERLRNAGVELAFPQMDLHLRDVPASVSIATLQNLRKQAAG